MRSHAPRADSVRNGFDGRASQSNSRFDCVAFSFIDQICSCIRVANQMAVLNPAIRICREDSGQISPPARAWTLVIFRTQNPLVSPSGNRNHGARYRFQHHRGQVHQEGPRQEEGSAKKAALISRGV